MIDLDVGALEDVAAVADGVDVVAAPDDDSVESSFDRIARPHHHELVPPHDRG